MYRKVFLCLALNCVLNVNLYNAVDISSKLDFGSSQPSSKLDFGAKLVDTSFKNNPVSKLHRPAKNDKVKLVYKFEDIGVVCISGNCNKTKVNEAEGINTDVVVQIKTNVDVIKTNNTVNVDDSTDDVPVIVGTPDNEFSDKTKQPSTYPFVTPSITPPVNVYPITTPKGENNFALNPSRNIVREDARSLVKGRLPIPHFEQSYYSHYFGENPPPQLIWYPKTSGYRVESARKPATGVTCFYRSEPARGLQWYPSRGVYNDPGSQINDKLAPLN